MNLTSHQKNIIIHIVIWGFLIHLIYDLIGLAGSLFLLFEEGYLDHALIIVPCIIALFYFNSYYLMPNYLKGKNWKQYLTVLILSGLATFVSSGFTFQGLLALGLQSDIELYEFIDIMIFNVLAVIGISTSLGFSKIAAEKDALNKKAIDKQKIAELKFLTTQVSPHFLFNSLNGIYSIAQDERAHLTSEAVLQLSNLMRYPFREGEMETVTLDKEINFLLDYINLQKLKLGVDYPIKFEFKNEEGYPKIAPLLLIPLIENAFKYGVSRANPQPIDISIMSTIKKVTLVASNAIIQNKNTESNQLGLNNLRERLNLLYPNNHQLKIENKGNKFVATLSIHLNKDN